MGKKHKKSKWKNLPSAFRTAVIGTILLLTVGIGLFLYGLIWRNVGSDDIHEADAEIISIDKVSRNLSQSQAEDMRKKGVDEDSIRYEIDVGYRYAINGKEGVYNKRENYKKINSLHIGDMVKLEYAVINGKIVFNPDTDTVFIFFGIAFIIVGLLVGIVAIVIRPKRRKSNKD